MPTVAELRAIIKHHQSKNCEKTSQMRKKELLEVVARIKRVRTQRELGVDVIKKKKAFKKSLILKEGETKSISKKIVPLTSPKKTFTNTTSIPAPRMSFAELEKYVLRLAARDNKITPAENKKYKMIISSAPKPWQDLVKRILAALTTSQKNDFKIKIATIKLSLVTNYIQSVALWALPSSDMDSARKERAAEKKPPKKRGESKQNVTKAQRKHMKQIKARAALINARYTAKLRGMSPTQQNNVRKIQSRLTKERRIDFKIGIAETESAEELEDFLKVMLLR